MYILLYISPTLLAFKAAARFRCWNLPILVRVAKWVYRVEQPIQDIWGRQTVLLLGQTFMLVFNVVMLHWYLIVVPLHLSKVFSVIGVFISRKWLCKSELLPHLSLWYILLCFKASSVRNSVLCAIWQHCVTWLLGDIF